VDNTHVAQYKVQRRAVVNTVMNLRVSYMAGECNNQLSDCQLLKQGSAPWS
jgi:hypothetical protein